MTMDICDDHESWSYSVVVFLFFLTMYVTADKLCVLAIPSVE